MTEQMPQEPLTKSAATLQTSGLCKAFGDVKVLRGLDLTVEPGVVYGFLGRNGAGKTTTIRAIIGLQPADSGTLRLFGEHVSTPGPGV